MIAAVDRDPQVTGVLDTMLAATLETAGVRQLAKINAAACQAFSFLDVLDVAAM